MLSLPLRRATVLALAGLSVAAAATQARPMAPKVLDARVSLGPTVLPALQAHPAGLTHRG